MTVTTQPATRFPNQPDPPNWTETEARAWMLGYLIGYDRGHTDGHHAGQIAGVEDLYQHVFNAPPHLDDETGSLFIAGETFDAIERRRARWRADRRARRARPGDYLGGPVPVWEG